MPPADAAPVAADASPPPHAAGPESARALIEGQLRMLTRLAEIGMEIAEAAGRRALGSLDEAVEAAPGPADPALAYARAARAVRMTVALQSRLLKDLAALDRAEGLARSARVAARRARIHRVVEQVIEAGRDDEDEIERLSSDAWERLRDEDDLGDLLDGPIEEAVARICQDLGLSPGWSGGVADAGPAPETSGDGPGPPFMALVSAAAAAGPAHPASRAASPSGP